MINCAMHLSLNRTHDDDSENKEICMTEKEKRPLNFYHRMLPILTQVRFDRYQLHTESIYNVLTAQKSLSV